MGIRGQLNARGSQFLRGIAYLRSMGDEGVPGTVAGHVTHQPATDIIVGWTSGIPATAATASSGVALPVNGLYHARAVVHVSGVAPGIASTVGAQFGIQMTLGGAPIFQSRRVITAASGVAALNSLEGIIMLECNATFEANASDVLRVVVRSNADAGTWTLCGQDESGGAANVYTVPAAYVHVQRMPTKDLDSDTYLV
jgi:hypothetical protein